MTQARLSPTRRKVNAWMRLLGLISLTACLPTLQPGQGVRPEFVGQWGCDYPSVMERAERLEAELPDGRAYIPQVGWSACSVLSHIGAPYDVDRQQVAGRRSATWWYRAGDDVRMLSLVQDGRQWRVDYVGW